MGAVWKEACPSLEGKESMCDVFLEELCVSWALKYELYLEEEGDCNNNDGKFARALCFERTVSSFECLD